MKTKILLLTVLLLIPPAVAAETTSAAEPAPASPPVLALAPADALAIVYVADPDSVYKSSSWAAMETVAEPAVTELAKATATVINGPTMIAVCGTPPNPLSMRIEFATQPRDGADAFFTNLNDVWLPMLSCGARSPGSSVQPSGTLRTFQLPGPVPFVLHAGVRDGVIYGSTNRADVAAWQGGDDLPGRFTTGDEAAKLPADTLTKADAFCYMDTEAAFLIPRTDFERFMPGLFANLGLERLQFAALTANWVSKGLSVDLILGLDDGPGGIWDLLAPRNAPLDIVAVIPEDYTIFVRGAMDSAADSMDRINEILRTIDADIVDEFAEECAEFRADYGFDPLEDLAGNLVDEWILGLRIDDKSNPTWVSAVRLADPSALQHQINVLSSAFDLTWETTTAHGATICSSPATSPAQFAWATVGEYLVVSNRPDPIVEVAAVESGAAPRGLLATSCLREVTRQLPSATANLAFVNVAPLARLAIKEAKGELLPPEALELLEKLGRATAGVGLCVTRGDGTLTIRAAVSDAINADVLGLSGKMMTLFLVRARQQAKRVVSMSNMRGIVVACLVHANDHKDNWPTSLTELARSGSVELTMFRAPYDESTAIITADNVDRTASYLYRPGTGLPLDAVVLCDRELHDGGAHFAFADGHVEWIEGARAAELLARMKIAAH